MMGTAAVAEHAWLKNLVGKWNVETEMVMGPDNVVKGTGIEEVSMMGDLWAMGVGTGTMPDGSTMEIRNGLGYDVSFKEYRGFWIMSVSSHLWKSSGKLSEDGKVMTLTCEGPSMEVDGATAMYRDVIEIVGENSRTLTSFFEDNDGNWQQMMKATYTRS